MPYCGKYICDTDIDNWPSGSDDADYKKVIDKIELMIDTVTGTSFVAEPFSIELNGNGKNRLFIPMVPAIITVTHLYIDCIELDSSWYDHDENSVYLTPCTSGTTALSPELYYKIGEAAEKGLFPRGYNNIRVIGTCGDSKCLPIVKQAAVILAKWENDPSLYGKSKFKSEHIGDYSYTKSDMAAEEEYLTGIEEADQLLRLCVKRKAILMTP